MKNPTERWDFFDKRVDECRIFVFDCKNLILIKVYAMILHKGGY